MLNRKLVLACLLSWAAGAAHAEPVVAGSGVFADGEVPACRTDLVYLNQMFGWQVRWRSEWSRLAAASNDEARAAMLRWQAAPAALAADEAALAATGSPRGRAPRVVVERVLAQIENLRASLRSGAPPLGSGVDGALRDQWSALFASRIAPAVDRFANFLRDRYLPRAPLAPGLGPAAGGAGCFRAFVRAFTTLDLPPVEIEEVGWRLLRAAEADMASLNGIDARALPGFLETLRAPARGGFSADQLIAKSEAAIARAFAAAPRAFSRDILQQIAVRPLPPEMESSFPAGAYQGSETGPASYVINTSRPSDRELMAEVIAFHETLPGHHARAAFGYPPGTFNSGFSEGWALYSEFLADELGLYGSKRDRTGMIAKHLWAAARLVVEPGLHVRGWSRAQAVEFMHRHTALSDAEIALEVDRYIAMPGQSLAYMLGYDRIASARCYARAKLGPSFKLTAFHDVILGGGSRPLDRVYADVVTWADGPGGRPASRVPRLPHGGRGPCSKFRR